MAGAASAREPRVLSSSRTDGSQAARSAKWPACRGAEAAGSSIVPRYHSIGVQVSNSVPECVTITLFSKPASPTPWR